MGVRGGGVMKSSTANARGSKTMLYTLRGYSKQNLSFFLLSSDCEMIFFFFLFYYNYDVLFVFNELAFLREVM